MASPAAERYLATFSPEDQATIRSGGDVDEWYQGALNAGAVPAEYAGNRSVNPSDPNQDPGWRLQTASGQNWWDATAQDAGINPWQQDYKAEFSRTTGQDLAQMSPEQRARWSMEHIDDLSAHGDRERAWRQWMYWQDSFDPNCPPAAPYQASDGSGCVEKPDNSNKGYLEAQEAGGGGGGGRGGAGEGEVGITGNAGANDLQRQLEAQYASKGGIFSPATEAGIRLNEGGILWKDNPPAATPPPTTPAPTPPPAQSAMPTGNQAAAIPPSQPGNAALISATLNAFTPNAPSAGAAPAATTQPANNWNATNSSQTRPNPALVNTITSQYQPQKPRVPTQGPGGRPWWQTA